MKPQEQKVIDLLTEGLEIEDACVIIISDTEAQLEYCIGNEYYTKPVEISVAFEPGYPATQWEPGYEGSAWITEHDLKGAQAKAFEDYVNNHEKEIEVELMEKIASAFYEEECERAEYENDCKQDR